MLWQAGRGTGKTDVRVIGFYSPEEKEVRGLQVSIPDSSATVAVY